MLRRVPWITALLLAAIPAATHAQDQPATESGDEHAVDAPTVDDAPAAPPEETARKLAVVVAGDPDPELQATALRVERAVAARLRAPFDPGLRAALRGEPGEAEDGLEEVRRERRRLGLDETRDAAILVSLGRRAGASAVAVVRAGESAPELLVLDVRNAAFFEGALALVNGVDDAQIARFVVRRARAAGRAAELPRPAPVPAPAEATQETPAPAEPDFFERFWPYGVAALLLAAMITAIALTSSAGGADQPVLRFVPGGR